MIVNINMTYPGIQTSCSRVTGLLHVARSNADMNIKNVQVDEPVIDHVLNKREPLCLIQFLSIYIHFHIDVLLDRGLTTIYHFHSVSLG